MGFTYTAKNNILNGMTGRSQYATLASTCMIGVGTMEGEVFVMEVPLLWQIKKLPFAAAFFASVIMSIHIMPATACLRGIPDYLRVRSDQDIFSPSFQLLTAGSVNYFIFFPVICNPHIY